MPKPKSVKKGRKVAKAAAANAVKKVPRPKLPEEPLDISIKGALDWIKSKDFNFKYGKQVGKEDFPYCNGQTGEILDRKVQDAWLEIATKFKTCLDFDDESDAQVESLKVRDSFIKKVRAAGYVGTVWEKSYAQSLKCRKILIQVGFCLFLIIC